MGGIHAPELGRQRKVNRGLRMAQALPGGDALAPLLRWRSGRNPGDNDNTTIHERAAGINCPAWFWLEDYVCFEWTVILCLSEPEISANCLTAVCIQGRLRC